jgi:hypothetical protein
MKVAFLILIIIIFSCDKDNYIENDPCKVCTTISKRGQTNIGTSIFKECDPVEIYHLEHAHIVWVINGNVYTKTTTCK